MGGYLLVGAVGAVTTFFTTFFVRRIAPRIGAVSMPGPRSVHTYPTPSLGGAAMFLGFCAALATASQLGQFSDMFDSSSEPVGLLLAAGVMFLVGAVDDLRPVSPPAKIAGQVLSASLLSLFGVTGKVAQEALDAAGITCNKNAIPNDPEKPFVTSGLRLGTASVTTAGMGEPEMVEIGSLIARVLGAVDDVGVRAEVLDAANRLCSLFSPYPDLS